jgi:hypothetical protein
MTNICPTYAPLIISSYINRETTTQYRMHLILELKAYMVQKELWLAERKYNGIMC